MSLVGTGLAYENQALAGLEKASQIQKRREGANKQAETAEVSQRASMAGLGAGAGAAIGAASAGASALAGAEAGSMAGPYGALIGAAVGYLGATLF